MSAEDHNTLVIIKIVYSATAPSYEGPSVTLELQPVCNNKGYFGKRLIRFGKPK